MRKYFFRGKRKDNGEWVIGKGIDTNFREAYILYGWKDASVGLFNVDDIEVIPETIGQYTGLIDKNGKKIFEGDIVKCTSRFDAKDMVVIFETAEFHLVDCQRYKNYTECCGYKHFGTLETEVIGNIHDNPELAEGLL